MSNEEMKAPVIPGYELCTVEEWDKLPWIDKGSIASFYYKRIKPKEKSIREIVDEEFGFHFLQDTKDKFAKCFERILENYVKKEG